MWNALSKSIGSRIALFQYESREGIEGRVIKKHKN
jgi:hypothetical protein